MIKRIMSDDLPFAATSKKKTDRNARMYPRL